MSLEWQPIETAPKDGTVVLLWVDNYPEFGSYSAPFFEGDEGYWQERSECVPLTDPEPTHWARILPPVEYRIRRPL